MYLAPLKYSGLAASGKHSAGAMQELRVIKHLPPPWPAPNLPTNLSVTNNEKLQLMQSLDIPQRPMVSVH